MSVDQEPATDVEALGRELGEAIADLPEYRRFEEAKAEVESDPEAQEQRQEFALARQTGDADREDMMALQRTQQELHSIPVMEQYLERQEELQDRLETVNEAISEPLAVDFGGEAGGCCND